MRIDAFTQVSQLYQNNNTKKVFKSNATQSADKLEISQIGKDYQIAKNAVAAAPDVREDKVNAIRSQMVSGTYNVQMEEVADKLLDSYYNETV